VRTRTCHADNSRIAETSEFKHFPCFGEAVTGHKDSVIPRYQRGPRLRVPGTGRGVFNGAGDRQVGVPICRGLPLRPLDWGMGMGPRRLQPPGRLETPAGSERRLPIYRGRGTVPGAYVRTRPAGDGCSCWVMWPGAAIRVVTAPQVAYLSARLGFTLWDDTISYVMKP
jgi:hypothetical protein